MFPPSKNTSALHLRRLSGDNADTSMTNATSKTTKVSFQKHRQHSEKKSSRFWLVATTFVCIFWACLISTTFPMSRVLSSPRADGSSALIRNRESSREISTVESSSDANPDDATTLSSKPLFLLHIGPPKTGTTTLQCYLGLHYPELAEQDNLYYLGTFYAPLCGLPLNYSIPGFVDVPRPSLLDCYAPHIQKHCDMDQQWKQFGDILQSHHEKGHSVIMSDEMFHHHFQLEDVLRLANILEQWDVRIMYTYRHFHSSIPSMYHQLNDPYATETGMANAVEKTIWPGEGGYRITPFQNSHSFSVEGELIRFSYWVITFGTVEVFNMEAVEGGSHNYLPSFFCHMIPEAKTTLCNTGNTGESRSTENRQDNNSASKFLHYDMLAVEAKEQGLLDETISRVVARDAVQEYCETNNWNSIDAFSLDCLSPERMQAFLEQSLRQAKIMEKYFVNRVPADTNSATMESEIRSEFSDYAARKQFCSVNAKLTIQGDERWHQFFRNLAKTR